MKKHRGSTLCLALIATIPLAAMGMSGPVLAQNEPIAMAKATDAPGLLAILKQAGYDAKFTPLEDEDRAASIEIATQKGNIFVQFSDCEDAVPDFCDTLVLSTSWDRSTPMADSVIAEANRTFRYVSIWRDEDGDPVMQWAILTRDTGVASPLFLNALQRYLSIVRDFDEIAFEDDETEEDPVDAPDAT